MKPRTKEEEDDLEWLRRLRDEGYDIPEEEAPIPFLLDVSLPYWEAYIFCVRSRQQGFNGANRITLSDINAFLQIANITNHDDKLEYTYFIQYIDGLIASLQEKTDGD